MQTMSHLHCNQVFGENRAKITEEGMREERGWQHLHGDLFWSYSYVNDSMVT